MMVLLSTSSSNAMVAQRTAAGIAAIALNPPYPLQAFQGLQQLAQFTTELQQSGNGLTARTQLLDQIRMIPVNSSNVAAIGYCDAIEF